MRILLMIVAYAVVSEDCGIAVRGLGADFLRVRSLPGTGTDGGPLRRALRNDAAEDGPG
jgi:hypothetical protein